MPAPSICVEEDQPPGQGQSLAPASTDTPSTDLGARRWVAGLLCILLVALIWTGATVLKQIIFRDLDYNEPLILAYVCNSCYMLHLPMYGLGRCGGCLPSVPFLRRRNNSVSGEGRSTPALMESMLLGLGIAPLWFFAQWTYSVGVASTSVTSSTVISTTSVVWTLLASVVFLGEKMTLLKAVGILTCMAGDVVNIWGNDTGTPGKSQQLHGDLLCLLSAMLYATYTTVLKKFSHLDTSVMMLFGTLGASCFLFAGPFMLAFEWGGLARMSGMIFGLLIFNGVFDNVLSQFAWAKAVQWTSPTVASVGLTLTIPLGVLADNLRGVALTGWAYLAAVLVICGFLAVSLASRPAEAPKPSSLDDSSARTLLSAAEHGPREAG